MTTAATTTSPRGPSRTGGFTLLEVLLTLGLLVAIASVTVFAFGGWRRTAQLNEGARRFEALLRASRAEAAVRGKRLRLTFVDDADAPGAFNCVIQWESDPVGAPGQYTPFADIGWRAFVPDDMVRVARCRRIGVDAVRMIPLGRDASQRDGFETVAFGPDGSSDSAEIVLLSADDRDSRGAVVRLDGFTGTIETEMLTAEQVDEVMSQ